MAKKGSDEELRWVKKQPGAKRSRSHGTPGYERDLMRDSATGDLRGPTESRKADIDEIVREYGGPSSPDSPSESGLVAELAVRGIIGAIEVAAFLRENPEVRQAIGDVVKLGAKMVALKTADAQRAMVARFAKRTEPAAITAEPETVDAELVEMEPEQPKVDVTSEDFRTQLQVALAYQQALNEMVDSLKRANIVDGDQLTPELNQAVQAVLEGRTAELDPDLLATLVAFLDEAEPEPMLEPRTEPEPPRGLSR